MIYEAGGSNAYSVSNDVSGSSSISLIASESDYAWQIIAVDECDEGPGFIFNGTGWGSGVQGLVNYWRDPN